MKLLKLTLKYFQRFRDFEILFNGKNTNITAENREGKTTIYNAVTWLLFEKDSLGKKDFDIKTRDENGDIIPAVDHSVEAIFDFNGIEIVLKRTLKEKYTRPRGKAEQVFDGHVTDHEINGVPKSKGEYAKFIENILPEKEFSILTSPLYFNEILPWQERRRMLVPLCPEITDDKIIAEVNPCQELVSRLKAVTIDDAKKASLASLKKINDELKLLPTRIDEARASIPENATGNLQQLAESAQRRAKEIESLQNKISATKHASGNAVTVEIAGINLDIEALEKRHGAMIDNQKAKASKMASDKSLRLSGLSTKVAIIQNNIMSAQARMDNLKKAEQDIIARWRTQKSLKFNQATCPTCGQFYPEDKLADAEKQFNEAKSKTLELIDNECSKNAQDILSQESELAKLSAELKEAEDTLQTATTTPTPALDSIPAVNELPEWIELHEKKNQLEKSIEQQDTSATDSIVKSLQEKIDGLTLQLKANNERITAIEMCEDINKRIGSHLNREKELSGMLEMEEKILFQIEELYRAKSRLLEDGINSKFSLVKFRLFENQINGGLAECCTCTIDGVPYPSINHSSQIKAGLDIINTLSLAKNFSPPVFIDNAEAVTSFEHLPPGQIIMLYAAKVPQGEMQIVNQP